MKKCPIIFFSILICLILYSCASIGNPSGGPKDEEPPRYVSSNPALGAVGVDAKRIEITFNEIVNVKDAFTKVAVSPTSRTVPRVSSMGHKVIVEFEDTMAENTTYTIDFGNAIEDNNESNKLQNFAFWFSTGEQLDTLQISGMVLAAKNLEPQQGVLVGVHRNPADTTFRRVRLERVAKTDDRGRFTIRNLSPGAYRVFALADVNNDFRWDNPAEDIAFLEMNITPYTEQTTATDTIYDLVHSCIDTIVQRQRTRFLPNDVLLSSFNIDYKSQYLVKNERVDSTRLSLIFNAKSDTLPELRLVDSDASIQDWYRLEHSRYNDTLTYWLKPDILLQDTIKVAAKYQRTDSAQNLVWGVDTLSFVTHRPKVKKEKKKKKNDTDTLSAPKIKFLDISFPSGGSVEYYDPLYLTFNQPIDSINQSAVKMEVQRDTLWQPVEHKISLIPVDTLSLLKYKIEYPWDFGTSYKLTVDSASIVGMYGLFNQPVTQEFKVKSEDEYSNYSFLISGLLPSVPAYVELLNSSDEPVRTAKVVDGVAEFLYIAPGSYYARLIEDYDGDGEYTTGDYDARRQPEFAYYYPKKINVKKNWEITQPWDILATAIDLQKPEAIKKNKPEADKNRRRQSSNEEEEEEEEYFDVDSNPFDPNSNRRNSSNRR